MYEELRKEEEENRAEAEKIKKLLPEHLTKAAREIDATTARLRKYFDGEDPRSIEELKHQTPAECVFHISALFEEILKFTPDIPEKLLRAETRDAVQKEILAHSPPPLTAPPETPKAEPGIGSGAGPPAALLALSNLKEVVGGLLQKDEVKSDPELKLQVLNSYWRLVYLTTEKKDEFALAA